MIIILMYAETIFACFAYVHMFRTSKLSFTVCSCSFVSISISLSSIILSPYTRLVSCSQSRTKSSGVLRQSTVENSRPYICIILYSGRITTCTKQYIHIYMYVCTSRIIKAYVCTYVPTTKLTAVYEKDRLPPRNRTQDQ